MKNDFYLQSHAAIQGSALSIIICIALDRLLKNSSYLAPRSAHYIVLHDQNFENNMQK